MEKETESQLSVSMDEKAPSHDYQLMNSPDTTTENCVVTCTVIVSELYVTNNAPNDGEEKTIEDVGSNQQPASTASVSRNKEARSHHRYKKLFLFERIGLAVVIVIIWGLLSLPIVFYHKPVESSSASITVSGADKCPSMVIYNGTVCRQELKSLTSCLPSDADNDIILIQSDQSETVRPLLDGLEAFASEECKAAALPFLCVYLFGLCDNTGKAFRPSSSQCIEISTGVCANEWALARSIPGDTILPDCASFPDVGELTEVVENCDNMMNDTDQDNSRLSGSSGQIDLNKEEDSSGMLLNETCECNEDFFCKETNKSVFGLALDDGSSLVCVPDCGTWGQYPRTTVITIDAIIIPAGIISIPIGIVGIVLAIVKRKKIITFPSVLVVYQILTTMLFSTTVLIRYTHRTGLYCSSRDLLEALTTATPYCIISGMVLYYCSLQLALWWIFYIVTLFWKLQFPFSARTFERNGRNRYLHFSAVIAGVFIPVIPIIISMVNHTVEESKSSNPLPGKLGFGLVTFPAPVMCFGTNSKVSYYSLILPVNVILIVGMPLLVVSFWIIHKHHGIFRVKNSKNVLNIGTAERKILVVFCYYVILTSLTLSQFTIETRNVDRLTSELVQYFLCEQSGPSTPCSREGFGEVLPQPALVGISQVLFYLFPLINLYFIVNFQEVKEKLKHCLAKFHPPKIMVTSKSCSDPPSTSRTALSWSKNTSE